MSDQRYLHVTGATTEDFGRVAVTDRAMRRTHPAAWFYGQPITLEDHQASRWIVEPMRLLDSAARSPTAARPRGHHLQPPRAAPGAAPVVRRRGTGGRC